ncbi:hypothetical protein [Photobacterium leiognathi]|uniref:hypothetical protein n=1 Tax=Photobacterium leiognathi TaxID=553611 RepID=UPI000D172F33|nr:hypothetical protein [Photobacterium leiognathi]PSW44403.1 hypothetical protein C0W40_09315 [Photobacterium leiognathi subsp. mandapamensis]
MKNPFESIRKLASSKLKHFKLMITIVMYLAAIIPLLSLGYLMGRTSSESSKWLLDLNSLLGAFGSLLGGLATVFAAWVAFGAYGTWKKQITHPEMFQHDLDVMDNLNRKHQEICSFINYECQDLILILNAYQHELDKFHAGDSVYRGVEKLREDYNILLSDVFKKMDLDCRRVYAGLFNDFHETVIDKVLSPFDDANNYNETLSLIMKYKEILQEVLFHSIYCSKIDSFKDGGIYNDESIRKAYYPSKFFGLMNPVECLDFYGRYYRLLNDTHKEIKLSYSKKWEL